jgi:hypothetical protein
MADNNITSTTTSGGTGTVTATEDVAGLKNALAQEREARKQAEKEAKAAAKTLEEVQGRLAKLEEDGKSETEKAIETARKEAAEEARSEERSKWQKVVLDARVEAKAAAKLADPDYARLLDLSGIEVDEDGSIKGDLDAAIDSLIKEKPALALRPGTRTPIDQGPQGGLAGESIEELFGRAITEQVKT